MIGTAGCGSDQDIPEAYTNLSAVSGTVLLNGKPLPAAAITFIPAGQQGVQPAYGLTDDAGKYELMTPVHGRSADENMGAVPGQYRVTINKLVMPNGSEIPKEQTHADAMQAGAQESLPAIYSNPERTTLTAEVIAGQEPKNFDFNLKSK